MPTITEEQKNLLAEFSFGLVEVRRVTRQLEADRTVTMSRALRLLRDPCETMPIMTGEITVCPHIYYSSASHDITPGNSTLPVSGKSTSVPSIPSSANHCKLRDKAPSKPLLKSLVRQLASKIADSIKGRFGAVWEPIDEGLVIWRPDENTDKEPSHEIRTPRRTFLLHIGSILDVNKFELEYLDR